MNFLLLKIDKVKIEDKKKVNLNNVNSKKQFLLQKMLIKLMLH
jgi:hypothetical protein